MNNEQSYRLSVAPMMGWTDRNCRDLHRLLSRRVLLYTEMVTAQAVIHGDRARLLDFDADQHPVALQLGGSEPALLAEAKALGVVLSAGHSMADAAQARAALAQGVTMFTHLFNAMPQMAARDPGVIAAALLSGASIVGGFHLTLTDD